MRFSLTICLIALAILTAGCVNQGSPTGQASLPAASSQLEIKGSDTLLQLVSNAAEAYTKENPNSMISVTGGGSGTGIAALINGEIDIADASRKIKEEELSQAAARGLDPWEFIIGRDMLSVIVNPDNDVKQLTKDQIGKIYLGEITNWSEVGGKDMEITLYGRQSTSGTYVFFMEQVVQGDYSPSMRNMEGNQAIVDAVRQDQTGIGYVGLGYIVDQSGNKVPGINVISVSDQGGPYISPLDKSKLSQYSISRALYQYTAKKPGKNSAVLDFILFELSQTGQKIVEETGFVEITAEDKEHNQALVDQI